MNAGPRPSKDHFKCPEELTDKPMNHFNPHMVFAKETRFADDEVPT